MQFLECRRRGLLILPHLDIVIDMAALGVDVRRPDLVVPCALDHKLSVKLLSELLVAIADGPLNVPALKSVAGLAGKVVLIAQVRLMSMWRIDAIVATS